MSLLRSSYRQAETRWGGGNNFAIYRHAYFMAEIEACPKYGRSGHWTGRWRPISIDWFDSSILQFSPKRPWQLNSGQAGEHRPCTETTARPQNDLLAKPRNQQQQRAKNCYNSRVPFRIRTRAKTNAKLLNQLVGDSGASIREFCTTCRAVKRKLAKKTKNVSSPGEFRHIETDVHGPDYSSNLLNTVLRPPLRAIRLLASAGTNS